MNPQRYEVLCTLPYPANSRSGAGFAAASDLRTLKRVFPAVHTIGAQIEKGPAATIDSRLVIEPAEQSRLRRALRSSVSTTPAICQRTRSIWTDLPTAICSLEKAAGTRGRGLVVFHSDVITTPTLSRLKSSFPHVRQIVRFQNCLGNSFDNLVSGYPLPKRIPWWLEIFRIKRLELYALQQSDLSYAISTEDADEMDRLYKVRPHGELEIGLDLERFRDSSDGPPTGVVHLGSLDLRKGRGMEEFLRSGWPKIRREIPEASLTLAGRGSEAHDSKENGISALGIVASEKTALRQGSVFINPQQSGSGVQLKSIIAMASAKALVSFKTGVEGIDAEANKHYIAVGSIEEFTNVVTMLLRSPTRAREMALAAQKHIVQRYQADIVTARNVDILHNHFLGLKELPLGGYKSGS